jgi:hypothetical protein
MVVGFVGVVYVLLLLITNVGLNMSEVDMVYGTSLSLESVKVIAESVGIGNLPDEAAKQLADDVSYRLKQIVQVSLAVS